jgi:hypothetical protein
LLQECRYTPKCKISSTTISIEQNPLMMEGHDG